MIRRALAWLRRLFHRPTNGSAIDWHDGAS
jgi:hypothetical protein